MRMKKKPGEMFLLSGRTVTRDDTTTWYLLRPRTFNSPVDIQKKPTTKFLVDIYLPKSPARLII